MPKCFSVLRYIIFLSFLGAIFIACDDDRLGAGNIPKQLAEPLVINSHQQLFALKEEQSTSLAFDLSKPKTDAEKLVIIDETGMNAKYYLKDINFDDFHVIKNNNEHAYIARVHEDDARKYGLNEGGRWFLLKNGSQPIRLDAPRAFRYTDPSEFIGQTESNGGLAFSYGTYFDLNGKSLSFGKNLNNVERVDFVSGDFVALKRDLAGKTRTTLVNTANGYRRDYQNYWVPEFVQIGKVQEGLMSDTSKSTSFTNKTAISKLEDEFDPKYMDQDERPVFLKDDPELDGQCLWFTSSARVPKQDAAFLVCYPGGSSDNYRMVFAEKKNNKYALKKITDIPSGAGLSVIKKARPFVQGGDFTLGYYGSQILYLSHTDPVANHKVINPGFNNILALRPSTDLTKFFIIGEKFNGDQIMQIYDSAGNKTGEKDIEVK